jgi:hypothetical protein
MRNIIFGVIALVFGAFVSIVFLRALAEDRLASDWQVSFIALGLSFFVFGAGVYYLAVGINKVRTPPGKKNSSTH